MRDGIFCTVIYINMICIGLKNQLSYSYRNDKESPLTEDAMGLFATSLDRHAFAPWSISALSRTFGFCICSHRDGGINASRDMEKNHDRIQLTQKDLMRNRTEPVTREETLSPA